MNITLRQATSADSQFCYCTKKSAHGENIVRTYGPWDEAFQRQFHEKQWKPEGVQILVVGRTDVGWIWSCHHADQIRIHGIYILPAHQRKGIGTFLVNRLREESVKTDKPVRLWVMKRNTAVEFYKKLGFAVIGQNKTHWAMEYRA